MPTSQQSAKAQQSRKSPTFAVTCSLCGLTAVALLAMVGVAIANRTGEVREVIKYKDGEIVTLEIPTLVDSYKGEEVKDVKARSVEQLMKQYGADGKAVAKANPKPSTPPSSGIGVRPAVSYSLGEQFPPITNPLVEKLVVDAKKEHLKGDMVRAVIKLDEAERLDPKEPAIIYRRALLAEDMFNWERASDAYENLFKMGPEIGEYYEIAADKIANGVQRAPDVVPFQLGHVVQKVTEDKHKAVVIIPIRKTTSREIEPSQIEIRIFFYDMVDNKSVKPVPSQREQNIAKRWAKPPADWSRGSETLEVIYKLPKQDVANEHLFGQRVYFGQVVEIYYKGELMDQYASIGRLHGIHAKEQYQSQIEPDILPLDLPPLQDPGDLLLPSLKE